MRGRSNLLGRLLATYAEFQSPTNMAAIERIKSLATVTAAVPVTFPASYPFSLVAALPKAPTPPHGARPSADALFNPGLGETAVAFLALIMSAQRKHILAFLESTVDIEGRENFTRFLMQLFRVSTSILDNDAFPSNWLNVNIMAHTTLVKLLDPIAAVLEASFIPDHRAAFVFDEQLWKEGISMVLKLLSSEQLVIEEFSAQVRTTASCSSI
jgi:dedicator of cytokinesis protein 3